MSTLPRAVALGAGGGRSRGASSRARERPSSLYDNLPAPTPPPPPPPAADASSDGDSSSAALPPPPPPPPPPPLAASTPAGRASRSLVSAAAETPSLLPALNTTVPVNVAARPADLAQRHAPTRSSLRHSRLVSKAYQQEAGPRPRAFRCRRLACALSGLSLLVGLFVCLLALWLLLWAPRMHPRDVPYWSGAPLFLSGLCGLTLAGCPGDFPGSCIKFFRVVSIILAIQAALSCLVAAILSMMHLILLHWAQCEPESALSTSCECHTETANILRYPDLSCPAVVNVLVLLLVGSCASNLMGCILAAWLLPLHWGRYRSHGYLPVASRPPS